MQKHPSLEKSVSPLSSDEFHEAIVKRMDKKSIDNFPIAKDLIDEIYEGTGFSIRESFNIFNQLMNEYCDDPLVEMIERRHAQKFASSVYAIKKFDEISESAIDLIANNPGCPQSSIVENLNISQPRASSLCSRLELEKVLRIEKDGTTNKCYLEILYKLSRG